MTRPPLPHDEQEVKARLQARIGGVLAALGFHEQPRGGKLMPRNPTRKDRNPGSFVIWTQPSAGAWKDYATGEAGDVYDLILYIKGLNDWIDAYWWALNFLGLGRHEVRSADQVKLDRERIAREQRAALARQDAERAAKARLARATWLAADPDWWDGGPVRTYLETARGLPIERLAGRPGAIRQIKACEHFDKATGEITTWPAMATAISGAGGNVTGLHLTWLAPDGSDKAPVEHAKKMRGVVVGGAIRIAKGASKLSPEAAEQAGKRGPLIITEGIEDALTAAIARPDDRVWAAGSLSLLGELKWPKCASAVVLVADNDWLKPAALAAFEAVEAKWKAMAEGRPLKVARADVGKDLNDWARGRAA